MRSTLGAALTSISVTIVAAAVGANSGIGCGPAPLFAAIASTRSPRRSRTWPPPSSLSVPVTAPLATSTTRSVWSVTTKIRRPSVLSTSGSSTPSSCTLVPEKSGTEPPAAPSLDTGMAVGTSASRLIGGRICGVVTASTGIGAARPVTPGRPPVRSAPARA